MIYKLKLHHYGFATKSINKSLEEFGELGYKSTSELVRDNIQGVDLLFIKNDNDHLIELVAPIEGIEGPVSRILKKSGSTLYHICYEVDDLGLTIRSLIEKKFILLMNPTPAIAFNNREICFLYNSHLGLIELLQK